MLIRKLSPSHFLSCIQQCRLVAWYSHFFACCPSPLGEHTHNGAGVSCCNPTIYCCSRRAVLCNVSMSRVWHNLSCEPDDGNEGQKWDILVAEEAAEEAGAAGVAVRVTTPVTQLLASTAMALALPPPLAVAPPPQDRAPAWACWAQVPGRAPKRVPQRPARQRILPGPAQADRVGVPPL